MFPTAEASGEIKNWRKKRGGTEVQSPSRCSSDHSAPHPEVHDGAVWLLPPVVGGGVWEETWGQNWKLPKSRKNNVGCFILQQIFQMVAGGPRRTNGPYFIESWIICNLQRWFYGIGIGFMFSSHIGACICIGICRYMWYVCMYRGGKEQK